MLVSVAMYIGRRIENEILSSLKNNPVTAVVGPRQCGKSTMVKKILSEIPKSIYLDLEKHSDLAKLENPEWFFNLNKSGLICIDEIQRKPDLFPLIRSLVDEWGQNGKFLVLGSASIDLLRQSSESLAGRISYKRLSPFLFGELLHETTLDQYIKRGGFPRSFLASDDAQSMIWRLDFISTFLERDLLQWAGFSTATMRRLWQMLAHLNGQTINYSSLGNSLSVSNVTIRNYIDLLESTFMVEVIPPYFSNLGKRLVKAPKVYINDSGITAALIGLDTINQLMGHPGFGAIWEQIVLTNLKAHFQFAEFFYYRTSSGAELDFVLKIKNKVFGVECKASLSPTMSKGNFFAIDDINPDYTFIAAPVNEGWKMEQSIEIVNLGNIFERISELLN